MAAGFGQGAINRRMAAKNASGKKGGGKAHPGFQAVQAKIGSQQGIPAKNAGAILAASSRGASPAAKKANPFLKKV